jgi:UDP-glucose 4-epimerase
VYNLGTGRKTTVRELLKALLALMGLDPAHPINELSGSVFDQSGLVADISLAEKDLNWRPGVELMEGLNKMVEWARKETL